MNSPVDVTPKEAVAQPPAVAVPGTPKAIVAALALSLALVFSHEMADAALRIFGRPLVMGRAAEHTRSCKNPTCATIGAPCFPETYTLCETVTARDGSVRYFRGLEVTTYRFKDGKTAGYRSTFFSSILAAVFVVIVIIIFAVSERQGIEYRNVRFRLSNVPADHIPIVCGYILGAAVFVYGIKMWLSEALPRLSAVLS